MSVGVFPFGRPIESVTQADRGPKRLFVLGAYASAVSARWVGDDGSTLINAVAVASEPEPFWRGEGVDEIVAGIPVPPGAGTLVPAGDNLNGPTGSALDELFIEPLGFRREHAWLSDLVPHSCKTERQAKALARAYDSRMSALGLPAYDWPLVPEELADDARRAQIAAEVLEASPDVLITLGDQPLRWFASAFGGRSKLAAYGETRDEYGRFHEVRIGARTMILLPLAHPRQVAKLGSYSAQWAALHEHWMYDVAPDLLLTGPD